MHCDHGSLLFFHVEELNKAILERIIKVHAVCGLELLNVPISEHKSAFGINDEKRPLHTPGVGVEPDFFVGNITDDRDFFRNLVVATQVFNASHQVISIVVRAPPISVHKHLHMLA